MTAEEFLINLGNEAYVDDGGNPVYFDTQVIESMQEFAKYHVQEALKQASEKVDTMTDWSSNGEPYEVLDRDTILEAYLPENIK